MYSVTMWMWIQGDASAIWLKRCETGEFLLLILYKSAPPTKRHSIFKVTLWGLIQYWNLDSFLICSARILALELLNSMFRAVLGAFVKIVYDV